MADTNDVFGNFLFSAVDAMAKKPQKTSEFTVPLEYADMLARRDEIGQARQALANSLMERENRGYNFGNALANLGGQTMPGQIDWLAALRGFGNAYTGRTNAAIDRATRDLEAANNDLGMALAYDKAMGTQTGIGYGDGNVAGPAVGGDKVIQNIATATDEGIDPESFIKEYKTGGFIESAASETDPQENPTLWARFTRSFLAPQNSGARSALKQNLTDKIIGPKIQNMVKNMGGARGADTIREVTARIGQIANIDSLGTDEQLGAILSAKMDALDIINRDRVASGMRPMSVEEFQPYWNKLFTGLAAYHKEYGTGRELENPRKSSKKTTTVPVEPKDDYSKYGF